MQLIKETTRFTGRDIKLKIPLGSTNNLNGLQQSINDYIERETGLSINPVTDGETFKYLAENEKDFDFEFKSGASYSSLYTFAGFTQSQVDNKDDVLLNSFFIMQIYDSIESENQILLHNSYYNGYDFTDRAEFTLPTTDEFMNLYIPEWFITENTGSTITIYAKFLFYNAKTGKLEIFFNKDKSAITTEDKMYHTLTIITLDKEYLYPVGTVNSRELDNAAYTEKVNESLDSFDKEAPVFPEGEQFNNDGTYTEVTT
jgi:hypothetical protein